MTTRSPLGLLGVVLLAACNRTSNPPNPTRPPAVDAPTAPTRPADITEDVPPAATDAGAADTDAAVTRTFEAPGIRVEVEASGSVHVRTTDMWDGGVDQAFETCAFVRNALGPLRRSLSADRIEVLVRACGEPRPGERPPTVAGARPARPVARPVARPAARPAAPR